MLLFAVRWFIRIINLIKEMKKDKLIKKQKIKLHTIISQDRIEIKIPE